MAFIPSPKSKDLSSDRVRLTISVPADVHATFQRMADASGSSLGKTMGDWLADTEQAAQEMVKMLERARAAPKLMVQEMHSFMLGLTEETAQLVEQVRQKSRASGTDGGPAVRGHSSAQTLDTPRPVIRGVKSPARGKRKAGGGQ